MVIKDFEPVPVAQGDGSVLAFVRVMRNLRERYPADADVVEAYSNILQAAIIKQAEARTALEASLAACRAFAQDVMECWPDGAPDGGELQELAEKHGMLREVIMPGPCGENCGCSEFLTAEDFPARCYRKTTALTGDPASDAAIDALRKEAPHAG